MNTPTTVSMPIRARRRRLFAIAAAALRPAHPPCWRSTSAATETTQSVAHESAYVQAISSLTPAQLAAAFGAGTYSTGPIWTSGLTPNERRHAEAIASLTHEQQAAAFGNGR
jgi:hypothetical protein